MYLSTNLSRCRIHLALLPELLNEHCCPWRTSDKIVRFFTLGYYPPSDTKEYTEDSPPSSADALTTLCADWENSAKLPDGCETRLVTLRIGVVLGRGGGVIQQTIWPFWLGLGGKNTFYYSTHCILHWFRHCLIWKNIIPSSENGTKIISFFHPFISGILGSGKQYFPWIHLDDMTGIIFHALENDHVTGVMNAVAPQVVTNESYTKEYAGALCRPAILPTPSFAINFIFGQDRGKILLEGQKVIPKRTLEMGYKFHYPELKQALAEIVK